MSKEAASGFTWKCDLCGRERHTVPETRPEGWDTMLSRDPSVSYTGSSGTDYCTDRQEHVQRAISERLDINA